MTDILAEIVAHKRIEVAERKRALPYAELTRDLANLPPTRGFGAALRRFTTDGGYGVIAEIKRASPSGGQIRTHFDPPAIARAYAEAGAACLSILTDEPFFQGTPEHLRTARAAVDLPILRKDFMIDPYQVAEARAWGADCILLIMACLDDGQAAELAATAREFGLDILVEVHDRPELDRALQLDAPLIGINNRNLKTLTTTLDTTLELAPAVPSDRLTVCESGLKTPQDLKRMADGGVRAFLIGESLLREPDPGVALRQLLAR